MHTNKNLIEEVVVIYSTGLNYRCITPIVDYTAHPVGTMIAERTSKE